MLSSQTANAVLSDTLLELFMTTRPVLLLLIAVAWLLLAALPGAHLAAQHVSEGVRCIPVNERTGELGCWIITDQPLGQIGKSETFWHLDIYPTRADAERARQPRGAVVETFGKIWLLSIEDKDWRPVGGEHLAEIGPLPIKAAEAYSAQYMEAVFTPGMTSSAHTHSGPEAWYTLSGETCLETPTGKQVGRAGGEYVIVPGGPPMHLTATGTETRRALVLILHETSKPPSTLVHDWTPKGLCKQ
jgi:quercetin dioxygenase-like cupin family protein